MSKRRSHGAGPRRITIMLLIAAALAAWAAAAPAASFDCAMAATAVEKTICADAELSELDDLLAEEYAKTLKRAPDQTALKSRQGAWVRETRDACASAECLTKVYLARIGALAAEGIPPGPREALPPQASYGDFVIAATYKDSDVCRAVEQSLRQHQLIPGTGELCDIPLPKNDKDFQRVPPWRDLDPKQNMQIVQEILFRGTFSYLHNYLQGDGVTDEEWDRQKRNNTILPEVMRKFWAAAGTRVEAIIAAGGLRLQKNRFDVNNDGTDETVYRMSALVRDRHERRQADGTPEYWLGPVIFAGKQCRVVRKGWDDRPYFHLLERETGRRIMLDGRVPSIRLVFFLYRGRTHAFRSGSGNIVRLAPAANDPIGLVSKNTCHFLAARENDKSESR